MRAAGEILLVALACAALYLGTARTPFYTRGEPREGLVVREMLASGEWIVPSRPGGEPARKPPLYYWAAAVALRAFPDTPEWALRLPSGAFATAAVLGTWATARVAFGAPAALPAALVLASAFEWTRAATSARVDMTLAGPLTLVLAAWTLALVRRGPWWMLAALGTALGTLAKGPVALALPALACAALVAAERRRDVLQRLRPVAVLAAGAGVAGLWYALALSRQGHAFAAVVARENWQRFLAADKHDHGAAYLLPLGLVGLLPWTPLLPLALVPLRRAARSPAAMLAASWAGTGLVFFSLAAGKRSVYLLPLYPAVALLIGAGVAAAPAGGRLARAAAFGVSLYAPVALVAAVLAGAIGLGLDPGAALRPWLRSADAAAAAILDLTVREVAAALFGGALVVFGVAVVAVRAARRGRWRMVVVLVAPVAVLTTALFNRVIHPAIARGLSLKTFGADVDRLVPPDAPLYAYFPADPGLRFYAPRPLLPWPPPDTAGGAHVLVWENQQARLHDRAGSPFPTVAASTSTQPHHGRLLLVTVPPGARIRTGSRSR